MAEDLTGKVNSAIEYVKKFDLENMPVGRYEISDGTFFNVQEYTTKQESLCSVESHKNYIDVQWIIKGIEKIKVMPVDKAECEIPYNPDRDIAFWKPGINMMESVLTPGAYVVLYPSDAHMPGIAVCKETENRKVVIKVKI